MTSISFQVVPSDPPKPHPTGGRLPFDSDGTSQAMRTWRRLARAHAAFTRAVSQHLNANHNLSISEYQALELLSRPGGQRMKRVDLADALQLTPSGVTRLLEGLEKAGLIKRTASQTDHRIAHARLTEQGASRLAEASVQHIRSIRTLFADRLSLDELDQLFELLGKLPGGTDRELPA